MSDWNESNAGNMYGKCRDSQVWLTTGDTGVSSAFRGAMSSFPLIGSIAAGFVADPMTNNAVRQCPGAVTDHTTPYRQTYVLIGLVVVLVFVYLFIPKK